MSSKKDILQLHSLPHAEKNSLRAEFWYREYLSRHLLLKNHALCQKIFTHMLKVRDRAIELFPGQDEITLVSEAIGKYFIAITPELKSLRPLKYSFDSFSNRTLFESLEEELEFLVDISTQYGFYAHTLLFPTSMDKVIGSIQAGKSAADFNAYTFCKVIPPPKDNPKITIEESNCSALRIFVELQDGNYNHKVIIDEISRVLASHRALRRQLNIKIELSSEEIEILATNGIYEDGIKIRKMADEARAIGLWCWDQVVAITNPDYTEHLKNEKGYLFTLKEPKPEHPVRSLLFSLIEKELLNSFHTPCPPMRQNCIYLPDDKKECSGRADICKHIGKKYNPCGTVGESCLCDELGKKNYNAKSKNRQCQHLTSCARKLTKIQKNATDCVNNCKILPIMGMEIR